MGAEEFLDQVTFVDVGAYTGDSLRRYVQMGGWVRHAHLFEPNPDLRIKRDFGCPVTIYRKAAWTSSGYRPFYISRLYAAAGSTLLPEKNTGDIDLDNPIQVECINFPAWLSQLDDRPLVLKVNAEGTEYKLTNGLARAGVLSNLSVIYMSLHAEKLGLPASADIALTSLLEGNGFRPHPSKVYSPVYCETWIAT